MAKKGSKNNIANRGAAARAKFLNGKEVMPVMMVGKDSRFIAARIKDGPLVLDKQGKAIPYDKIQ